MVAAEVGEEFFARISGDERFEVVRRLAGSEDELAAAAADAVVLVTRSYNPVTAQVIAAAPHLEVIAQGTSGTDNIDRTAAAARGIAVVSLPGENANAVAELVIGVILSLTRTIPFYGREMAAGRWQRSDCATRHEMRHYRLGIVGLGQVGRRVSRLAGAFGMTVQASDPYLSDADFAERGATSAGSLEDLLRSSDILTLHVPLTEETRGMIGSREIGLLPQGAFLINTARGEVLDRAAALDALATSHLSGLALDVYDPEPPAGSWPDDPRLITTPHIAGCTYECRTAIGARLYEQIAAHYGTPVSS